MLFTITPFFNWGFIPSATARAAVSLPPPAPKGTRISIALSGYSAAVAFKLPKISPTRENNAKLKQNAFLIFPPPFVLSCPW